MPSAYLCFPLIVLRFLPKFGIKGDSNVFFLILFVLKQQWRGLLIGHVEQLSFIKLVQSTTMNIFSEYCLYFLPCFAQFQYRESFLIYGQLPNSYSFQLIKNSCGQHTILKVSRSFFNDNFMIIYVMWSKVLVMNFLRTRYKYK